MIYGVRVQSSRYMALAKKLTSKCRGKQASVDTEPSAFLLPSLGSFGSTRLRPSIYGKQTNVASPDTHKSWERVEKRWEGNSFHVANLALTTVWIFHSCFCSVPCLPNLNVL